MTEKTKNKIKLKNWVKVTLGALIVFIVIIIVEARYNSRTIRVKKIIIENTNENRFIDDDEIKRLLSANGEEELNTLTFKDVSVKALEARVEANLFIDNCEVSRNLQGELHVQVTQAKPIARFIREGKPDFYIDSTGKFMNVLDKYTAKVMLITREKSSQLPNFKEKDKRLLKLINYLHKDKFFNAQITQLDIDKYGDITMYVQVGKHYIEFGNLSKIEEKLKHIRIFYDKILPIKGWTAYKKVSVKYKGQIICE